MKKKTKLVYISGPIGDLEKPSATVNIENAVKFGCFINDNFGMYGIVPVIPHVIALSDYAKLSDYEYWMDYDLRLVRSCDALIRLPGESAGSDREVNEARANGLNYYILSDKELCSPKLANILSCKFFEHCGFLDE